MVASLIAIAPAAAAGFAGLTARRARTREQQAERRHRPSGLMIRVAGRIVHADVAGDGPDLILLHGASGNSREFTFQLFDRLKTRFRVIAFDRPGLGWSDDLGPAGIAPLGQVEALRGAAARLGVLKPILLGQSYGGAVAMSWAVHYPDEVAALVVVSGATNPWSGGLGLWYKANDTDLGAATLIPLVTAWHSRRMLLRTVTGVFDPDPVPPGYIDHVGLPLTLRRKVLRANARQVNGLLPHVRQMAPRYGALTMPLEIVHGTADTIVPIGVHAERLVRQVPGANLTRLSGAGHMPHHTRPDAVVAAIHRAAARAGRR